jgi:hypothetical protein
LAIRLLDLQLLYGIAGAREQFEHLYADLIRAECTGAKEVRCQSGDGGVDVYIDDWADPKGISVFQVKYFPMGLGSSQKEQVRRSFRSCLENDHFVVSRWTLCLPVDLNQEEIAWFTIWKHQQANTTLVAAHIDWWGESALRPLLLQPKNAGVKEAYFHQEHVAQIREMYRMLTHLLEDFATRPEESVMVLALRQDAEEANLRYRDEVYGPLHTELKGIREALERARAGKGPYPLWIPVKGEQLPQHMRYTPPTAVGATFQLWPAFKEAFRLYGALTSPARDRLDGIEVAVTAYNHALEGAREAAVPLLEPYVAQALEAEAQLPAYLEWKRTYKDAPTPPPYQSFPWFELIERLTSSGSYTSEEIAAAWLRRPLQAFGWLLADQPDETGRCVFDDYERSAVMLRSPSVFQDTFTQAMPELQGTTPFQHAKRAQKHLYPLVAAMEIALLNVLINIQHEYEGGPPPF